MKQQDLVSMVVTKEMAAALLALIEQMRAILPGTISLETDERRSLTLMGPRSEPFGRLALVTIRQNMELLPRGIDLDATFADLESRDNLIPVLKSLQQFVEELDDTVAAYGSDVMQIANLSYSLIKSAGGGAGLDEARKQLSFRHRKRSKKSENPEGESTE